ncbi:MAG: alanine racemase [Elusimicrobia bacterium]|nr:alanine racemase [Elusimicrobiota bacterium]MDE2426160.1 alanine racemase [Elusimicrobiota bacterium]
MTDLKWVEIDLAAIRANLRWVRSRLSPGAALMAVVKADAYGHGAAAVARQAVANGASCLGVLTTAEAEALRQSGIAAPIVLLAPIVPPNAAQVARLRLTATIDDLDQAAALDRAAKRERLGVHVDLDFGLGRWGLPPRRLAAFLDALRRFKRLEFKGLSTHIDYVAGKNAVEAEEKLRSFAKLAAAAKRRHPGLLAHAANSSVLLDFPHWQLDMVRVGNLLYGINAAKAKTDSLKNPWTFQARIIALHDVPRGRSIGYASEYVAARAMRVATLPAGYADGLTMEPAERLISFGPGFQYWGTLRGVRTPFIGRVGISHVLVDVTDVKDAAVGEAVALPIRRTAASSNLPRRYL